MADETNTTQTTPASAPNDAGIKNSSARAPNPFEAAAERANTAAEKPVRRGGVSFFTALVMSTLATAGGAYLALFAQSRPDLLQTAGLATIMPKPADSIGNMELAALAMRVKVIEGEIAAMKSTPMGQPLALPVPKQVAPAVALPKDGPETSNPAPAPTPALAPVLAGPTPDFGDLKAQLEGVSGRVTAIETRLAALDPTGAGGAMIASLQTEIANLKAVVAGLQSQAASAPSPGVTFAVVSLAEAANRPGPFMPEFEAVRAAMPGVPEVAALEALARSGAPTRALLAERFSALGPAVTAMADPTTGEGGLVTWIRALFTDMVKVQPAPSASGSGPAAILLRAKTKLDQGDLAGALEDVRGVAPAPDEVRSWIAGAEKRLEIETRIAGLRGAVERGRSAPSAGEPASGPAISPASTPATPTLQLAEPAKKPAPATETAR